jgi:hypothetical protein
LLLEEAANKARFTNTTRTNQNQLRRDLVGHSGLRETVKCGLKKWGTTSL